ncbi:carbamoyl phosphate synthase small subunit [Fictibacillus macauensis ZFHKF-1]|uniref:Carbamoyl phosphate synthase small chain n=1 Tax=Fictibacillus macauensis ZFHKF-1 TaxID=1196324 RepID=I8IZW5_9BACL|nr:carbamoyl phosphate synthase small subunit [Fictibacillus macauensis]EIT85021.1 carbamoyl phosphate synthase small subunit [Fictibacillus macauensis ZFHKF-1]
MKRTLLLEDGTMFTGSGFGSEYDRAGEVVFNTGMTGYQEILSDPSYCGQIVTLTYPLIGNYGVNRKDFESISPAVHGLIVHEHCPLPSHHESMGTLDELLKVKQIPGLSGIDTRKLTRLIRRYGTLRGKFITGELSNIEEQLQQLQQSATNHHHVATVSTSTPYHMPNTGKRVVVVDYGVKSGILRELSKRGLDVIVVPYNVTAESILLLNPDGVLLSNGPGDPKDVPEALPMINAILEQNIPLFGICLGHQLLALACGGNTEKLTFGHRGSNHPVREIATGKITMTAQNHGYAVRKESLSTTELLLTHEAVNDETVEGLAHKTKRAFSVQYHPEASPGPMDANLLFEQFQSLMEAEKREENEQCLNVQI